jgi:single stranded DNA-binding protein (ssb)
MANFNFNKVILGGRLTEDPKLSTTSSGVSVASFTVAVNRRSKDNETDFIRCTAWRQTADFVCRYFMKASSICLIGTLQNKNWTDQQGVKHYTNEIVVDEAMFVDSKNESRTEARVEMNEAVNAPVLEEIGPDEDLPF